MTLLLVMSGETLLGLISAGQMRGGGTPGAKEASKNNFPILLALLSVFGVAAPVT